MRDDKSVTAGIALGAFLGLVACKAFKGEATPIDEVKRTFGKDHSCPAERVEARPRSELKAYDLVWGERTPPPAVSADPARLAVWTKEEQAKRDTWNDTQQVFEARGCSEQFLYVCGHATMRSGETSPWACQPRDYPPGVAKW